jgi:hypothetical protein
MSAGERLFDGVGLCTSRSSPPDRPAEDLRDKRSLPSGVTRVKRIGHQPKSTGARPVDHAATRATPRRRVLQLATDDDRAVLASSADRLFKGDEDTFDPARPDAALNFDGGDRLELPAVSSMLVEHLLELGAGHLAADHALAEFDHHVLVAVRYATTIVAASPDSCQS